MPNTVPCGEFTVYYHEGFTGRSQGLEMMLVASKAKWKRAPWSEVKDPTCFAAPALGHDQTGKMISQTTAAAQWLGTEVGFRPPTGLRAEALKIALDITVNGETMTLDFSRTAPPCAGPVNIARSTAIAACYVALKHVFRDVPANAGCLEPISFVIPENSLLSARAPKPVAAMAIM
jgi:hypothetical protein